MLDKIRVPFQLLQRQPGMDKSDIRIELNFYCVQITQALKNAEKFAVPVRTCRSGTEKFGWSSNESLKSACQSSKFWLSLWNDCDKPRNGVVNTSRLLTKPHFQKELKAYRVGQSVAIAESIANDPNKLSKTRLANNKTRESKITIGEYQWNSYFKSQFTEPDVNILKKFETDLNNRLRTPGSGTSVVSSSELRDVIRKLNKRQSMGYDGICALHLQNGSDKLMCHLSLLYQMIFCCGIVPDSFCVGLISPILKKRKDPFECSSYRPIAASSVFAKVFELLIINNQRSLCYILPDQFGFQPKLGCFHALKCLCNLLSDADKSGGTLALGTYDVSKAFG